jgi:uncharacterized protein YjiS (DUF1127 family)
MTALRFDVTPAEPTAPAGWSPGPVSCRVPVQGHSSLIGMARRLWRRHRSRIELAHMNEHMLKDIGVTYAEAEREVNKPFWRP